LGRAKDLSDFVKHGHEKATIEIELKRRGAKQNLVIQRRLLKANNTSTWKLNGKRKWKDLILNFMYIHISLYI